jgi:hypothetical protein
MNAFDHYNDFDNTKYHLKGSTDYVCLGFSTYGQEDIMKNGGKEMLETIYKEYYGPYVPAVEEARITLGVDRSKLPSKTC